ncbi:hypothetical protein EDD21DRAFT_312927 [Dissophora ornata]|nr:hypothetical protein EDD21DRAFT_312927 [Dissophora ornata]
MDQSQAQKRKRTAIHEARIENRTVLPSTAVPRLCKQVQHQFSAHYPWMCRRYSTMASVPLMLTQEIKDLVAYLSPTDEENTIRRLVFRSIKRAILSLWPNAQVDIYGSYDTGLCLPTSDLDILVRKQDEVTQRNIRLLAGRLQKLGIATSVELVLYAKVPLIKFKERCSNIDVDISFNKPSGVDGAAVSKDFMDRTPGLKPLTILVKHFLMIRGLNEPYSGGLGSYGTMLMILSFLQRHPMVSTGLINPSENLGVLFIEFMELYGRHFNFEDVGMSVTDGGSYFPMPQMYNESHNTTRRETGQGAKAQSQLKNVRIIMLDPLDPQNNVTKPAFKYPAVMSHFAKAYERITAAVEIRHKELLHGESAVVGEVSLIDGILWVSQEIINRREELRLVYMNRDMFM